MTGSAAAPLAGVAAVVTGASRGIGLATTRALVRAGARVAMLARHAEPLEARARELGDGAVAIPCDVTDRDQVTRAIARIVNELDEAPAILVNNAGLFSLARVEDTTPHDFACAIDVNLVAPFLLARAFLPEMRARGRGHIVTVGSVADRVAYPENGAYAASKYGARALHEVLRAELRGTGVRASLVSPGPTDTEMWDPVRPEERPGFTPRSAMLGADAVADAILYVVTRDASVNVDELRLTHS
ncbi:MAG TPA: SDR family oxidoreductase [Gemmatimonadaceae bacterium]|nr:SDR family oxidoreductase [Gemmatimonadaceae bacterium]